MTALTTLNRICEHLEKYVYDRIWNEPYSEYRSYIRMPIINQTTTTGDDTMVLSVQNGVISGGSQLTVDATSGKGVMQGSGLGVASGVIYGNTVANNTKYLPAAGYLAGRYSRILLPPFKSNEELVNGSWFSTTIPKFYVFTVPAAFFSPLEINVLDWTLLSEYCNQNLVSLQVFHKNGRILNRGQIYIKQSDMNDCMLVAVNAVMFNAIAGSTADPSYTYFGKYYDSDSVADNVVKSGMLTSTTAKDPQPTYDTDNATFTFYNGKLCTGSYKNYLVQNNYLETVHDDDVIDTFDVEVLSTHNAPIYTDELLEDGTTGTQKQRLLVHIPKSINPDSYLITPHTCELFLIPRTMSAGNPCISGVYVYPCGRDDEFFQISHNDFSIDLSMLKQIATDNNFTDYFLRVFVRIHTKKRVVVRDANYVDILYNLSDEDIMTFLLGKHAWQRSWGSVITTYHPTITTYWYRKSPSSGGPTVPEPSDWKCATSVTTEEKFLEIKNAGNLMYAQPYNHLQFWKADHLENCKYADALIRRRDGHYQDATTQCSICPKKDGCTKEKEELTIKLEEEEITPREVNRLNELTAYFAGESTCDKFVRTNNNQCKHCGLMSRCSEIDIGAGTYVVDHNCPCYSVRSIQDYVDILGYFHILALIGKRVSHFKVTTAGTTSVVVYAPLALSYPELGYTDYLPLVYHNGIRIDQSRISFTTTTGDNNGVVEIFSDTGYLKNTNVIQSNYATRLKISIDPKYHISTHYSCVESGIYYYLSDSNEYILAKGCSASEYDQMTEEEKALIDYIYGDKIHKKTYELVDAETTFLANLSYYVEDALESTGYRLLVAGTDYEIGEQLIDWIAATGQAVYHKWTVFYNADEEFLKDDTIVVELFDNRTKGQVKHYQCTADQTTRTIKVATLDQWKVYLMSYDTTNKRMKYTYVADPGTLDTTKGSDEMYTLYIKSDLATTPFDIMVVEGPKVMEETWSRPITESTFGCLGYDFWADAYSEYPNSATINYPLDMETIFLNGKRLVKNMDYAVAGYLDDSYDTGENGDRYNIKLYEQNLSYLRESNKFDVVRSCTTNISSQYGFLIGKSISWLGRAPLWFDELSTLSIDGVLCSHVTHTFGTVSITDDVHRNGAPYEIRTAVSTRVKDIIGCDESMDEDAEKIVAIRNFFDRYSELDPTRAIIPHSHKIYSPYIEAICNAFLNDSNFEFFKIGEETTKAVGSLPSGTTITAANFEQQFTAWTELREHDLFFNKYDDYDLQFVDIYPLYHRVSTQYRETYNRLVYLYTTLMGTRDEIKHKDAPHE